MAVDQDRTLTYDQARDFALDSAGFTGACPVSDETLEVLLLNCLGQLYSQIWDHKHYQEIWRFSIAEGQCAPTRPGEEEGEFIELCTDEIFQPRFRIINKIERARDCKELYESDCFPSKAKKQTPDPTNEADSFPTKEELVTKWLDRGKLKEVTHSTVLTGEQPLSTGDHRCEWYCWGDQFLVTPPQPQDEDYTVYGYRKLNRTLWLPSDDDPNKIVWQRVDLPEEFHTPYQKCVLGFLYAQCGDTELAREWLRIASDETNAIVNLNDGELTNRTPTDDGPCYMNGGPRPTYHCPPPRFHFEQLDGDLPRGLW